MSVRDSDFQVTPPDEMSHLWTDDSEQGFWPEIMEGHHTGGCFCWRCWTGCRYELPNAAMARIYEQEWLRLQEAVEHDSAFGVGTWYDSTNDTWRREQEQRKEFDDMDPSHMYIWCKESQAHVLTVHPEMGLWHQHVTVDHARKRHQEGLPPHLHWLLHVPSTRRRGRQRS